MPVIPSVSIHYRNVNKVYIVQHLIINYIGVILVSEDVASLLSSIVGILFVFFNALAIGASYFRSGAADAATVDNKSMLESDIGLS